MNDATRHQANRNTAWATIKELKGEVVECSNTKDGMCKWTVVESVEEDIFESVREKEEKLYDTNHLAVIDPDKMFSEEDYSKSFWFLWPETIDKDLQTLCSIIEKDNIQRKAEYKRVIKMVRKSEFVCFHALMIASSAYSDKGDKLWAEEKYAHKSKKRRGLSVNVDFGKYMKRWRFRQISNYIAQVMENHETRDTDDWWRFRERVKLFNKKRMLNYESSHVLVFDESMSAFVPR